MPRPGFELILLAIERDLPLLSISLPYIERFIGPERASLLGSRACLGKARAMGIGSAGGLPLIFLDEDEAVPGLSLGLVRGLIADRGGDPDRAGWYFKQILNLAYSLRPGTRPFYLTWDADTIPVRGLEFFDGEGRVLMTMKEEHHAPYFSTMRRLIGLDKATERSFIAEHMMFERDEVRSLLGRIVGGRAAAGDAVARRIVEAVEPRDLGGSGFAEYETYGTFMYSTARDKIALRTLPSLRHGTAFFGRRPSRAQLFALSGRYHWASFEAWRVSTPRTRLSFALRRLAGAAWTAASLVLAPRRYGRFKADIENHRSSGR